MDEAICGAQEMLTWLKMELYSKASQCLNDYELKELIGWYLYEGLKRYFDKNILLCNIEDKEKLKNIAATLTDIEINQGKKPPVFRTGDQVEVIVNAKNITYHKGYILQSIYHFKEREWMYFISENGKKIGKRYFESNLNKIL